MQNETVKKKPKIRKKRLRKCIREQMEFYFSDSNLDKDKFLNELLKRCPEVDLETFLNFNKIRLLTIKHRSVSTKINEIANAIEGSEELKLTDDRKRVYRVKERKSKSNVDDCTIYVEGLRSNTTIERIKQFFCKFGKIDYVSLPKYKDGAKKLKGFAFIEFNQCTSAENAVKYFTKYPCTDDNQSENLCKRKIEKKVKDHNVASIVENRSEDVEPSNNDPVENNNEVDIKNFKKFAKKKKYKVITKNEWKKLRNEYKNRQRMKASKIKICLRAISAELKSKNDQKTETVEKVQSTYVVTENKPLEQSEPTIVPSQNLNEKIDEDPIKDEPKLVTEGEKLPTIEIEKKSLVNGVFVKFVLKEPCSDKKSIQNLIKLTNPDIMYVDVKTKAMNGFLRFNNLQNATKYCEMGIMYEITGLFSSFELLNDKETTDYLIGVNQKLSVRYSKRKNIRGRDRIKKRLKNSMNNNDLI